MYRKVAVILFLLILLIAPAALAQGLHVPSQAPDGSTASAEPTASALADSTAADTSQPASSQPAATQPSVSQPAASPPATPQQAQSGMMMPILVAVAILAVVAVVAVIIARSRQKKAPVYRSTRRGR